MGERIDRTEEDSGYSRRPHEYHRRRLRFVDELLTAAHKLWMSSSCSSSVHMFMSIPDVCRDDDDMLGGAQIVKNEFGET